MHSTLVREMVDLAIDQAQMEHPHVDFSILLCPAHAAALGATSYRGHEVVATELVDDSRVRLEPLPGGPRAARAFSYVLDLDEEIISVYGGVMDPAQVASSAASATAAAASAISRSVPA